MFEYYPYGENETTKEPKPESGRLKSITDPAGRQLEFTYDAATGDLGNLVKYSNSPKDAEGHLLSFQMNGLKPRL